MRWRWLLSLCFVGGCAVTVGGQTGQEDLEQGPIYSPCPAPPVPITEDEDPGVGFAPIDVVNNLAVPHQQSLRWSHTDQSTRLTMTLVEAHDFEHWLGTGGRSCPPQIIVYALMQVTTDDGQLNEFVDLRFIADSPEKATVSGGLQLEALGGTFRPAAHGLELSQWRDPLIELRLKLDDQLTGTLALVGDDPTPEDGNAPADAVLATLAD